MAISTTRPSAASQPPLPMPASPPAKPSSGDSRATPATDLSSLASLLQGGGGKAPSTAKNGVAIIDSFSPAPGEPVPHGQDVNQVVRQTTQAASTPIRKVPLPLEGGNGQGLDGRIEARAAGLLDASSQAMEGILRNPGSTRVINQSLGTSPARVVKEVSEEVAQENIERKKQGLPEGMGPKAVALKKELGFAGDAQVGGPPLLQALVNHVENTFENSPRIAAARQRYAEQTQKLENAGILNVVSSGNEGDFVDALKQAGISLDKNFSDSVLANDKAITVGATTGGGQLAPFSTANNTVDVAADGTDVDVGNGRTNNGTSFSAPQVAATLSDMFAANPNLTNDQARAILYESAHDTGLTAQQEGHGILDADQARGLAALSALALQVPSA